MAPHHRIRLTVIPALALIGASSLLANSVGLASSGRSAPHTSRSVVAPARTVASAANAAPMACYDLPVSSAVLAPQSCWRTGDTSAFLVGLVPGNSDEGAIVIVQGQAQKLVQLPGSGVLRVTEVNGQSACVMNAQQEFRSADLISGTVSASWSPTCSLSSENGPAATPAVTAPTSSGPTSANSSAAISNSNPAVPTATISYYEYYAYYSECGSIPSGNCPLYQQGATTHTTPQNGLVVLDFGSPCYLPNDPSVYGVEMFFQPTCVPDSSLRSMVDNWISGYETQNQNSAVNLTLALGTSNSYNGVDSNYALTDAQMTASGQSWYQDLVGAISTAGLSAPLTIWGADDMEQASDNEWSTGDPTVAWVQGFDSASPADRGCSLEQGGYLADYGDDVLGGSTTPEDGWTVQQVYDVSWGLPAACAEPEVYYSDMATEWQHLSQWAVTNGYSAISFSGVMTEVESGTLSPFEAWSDLESDTGQSPEIPSITTIAWTLQGQPPPPPAVADLSPSDGPVTGGTQVVLYGSNFLGAQSVDFGSEAAASFVIDDSDLLTAVTPAGSAGAVDVTVMTPEGPSAATSGAVFTYGTGPLVGNVSPHEGPVDGGTSLTITGSGFEGSGVTTTAVHFGATAVTTACPALSCFTVDSPSQISVTVPARPVGQVDVTVTTSSGTSLSTTGDKFAYQLPELIAINSNSSWLTTSNFSGFTPPVQASDVPFYGTVATLVGDVNGDGIPDLIAVNTNSVWVMLGTRTGFLPPVEWSPFPFYGSQATLAGAVTGDGMTDLIAVDGNSTWVMLSTGAGFLPPVEWSSSAFDGSQATLVGDVTGAGMADLIAVNASSTWVMQSTGTGFAAPEEWSTVPFYGSETTLAGDVTGSNGTDLVSVNGKSVWVMPSTGTSFAAPEEWSSSAFYGTQATFALDASGGTVAGLVAVDSGQTWVLTSTASAFALPSVWLNLPFYGSRETFAAG